MNLFANYRLEKGEELKESDYLGDLGVDGRIILKF
jgi:hypothetical protein